MTLTCLVVLAAIPPAPAECSGTRFTRECPVARLTSAGLKARARPSRPHAHEHAHEPTAKRNVSFATKVEVSKFRVEKSKRRTAAGEKFKNRDKKGGRDRAGGPGAALRIEDTSASKGARDTGSTSGAGSAHAHKQKRRPRVGQPTRAGASDADATVTPLASKTEPRSRNKTKRKAKSAGHE